MIQLRPTFSESWYRVANLRARLRATAQISRQYYRGERWYVVRDPAGNQFHRLSDSAYRFVGLLDGSRTVQEAWEMVGGQLADDAPTQPEVIQILSQLHAANLLEADIPADAAVLLRRHKMLQKRQLQGRLMNMLFPRMRLWDPDAFLKRWMPLMKPILSFGGTIVWFIVVIAALAVVLPHWKQFWQVIEGALEIQQNPENLLYMFGVFWGIKFIHELGHAFMCRRFGGEVHEMGLMLLVFIPTPYVDASTAWGFPNKWHRILVAAGGMIFELFIAALMAFVWVATKDGSNTFISNMAAYAMGIASVTTILFNANPLLRYDGYYILSDWLEIPNLRQRSTEYALGLIKRHVFRVKSPLPLPPIRQRIWLFTYAIASGIYRIFIGVLIILMVAWKVPMLGMLMAIGGVVTWLVVPVVKLFKYLTIDPELHRKRGRAIAFTVAVATSIIILVGIIPFPVYVRAEGAVEPAQKDVIYAATPGWVRQIAAKDGQWLEKGQLIVMLEDRDLETELIKVQSQIESVELEKRKALGMSEQARWLAADKHLKALSEQLKDLQQRKEDLTIEAPIAGKLIAPQIEELHGRFVSRGQEMFTLAKMDQLEVRASVQQSDAELINEIQQPQAEVRVAGDIGTVLPGGKVTASPAAKRELAHSLLGAGGGGENMVDPRDATGKQARIPHFELRVELPNVGAFYLPGQRAYVRVKYDNRPLLWQWGRRFLQLVQTQSQSPWY